MSTSTPQFKFTYFSLKALGEVSRVLFALANQEYENVRLSFEEWPQYKQQMVFEQIPVLDVTENGQTVQIAQSNAIERYLATRFNLFGKNEIEKVSFFLLKCHDLILIFVSFNIFIQIRQRST
jgi:glutathione S-transferase